MSSSISLPFSISNAYQGFAKAGGILAATDRELVLELEVKDGLVGVLKSSNVVKIPIDQIISVHLQSFWLRHRLVIRTNSMTLLSKIPGNNAGQIALWIARKDKDLADRFILFVRSSINEQELNRLNQEILKLSDADI